MAISRARTVILHYGACTLFNGPVLINYTGRPFQSSCYLYLTVYISIRYNKPYSKLDSHTPPNVYCTGYCNISYHIKTDTPGTSF